MILSICDSAEVLKVMKIVKILIQIIRIAVPIMLIVSSMITFAGAVADASADNSKAIQISIKRIVAAIIIFFIPLVVRVTINLVSGDDSYSKCFGSSYVRK